MYASGPITGIKTKTVNAILKNVGSAPAQILLAMAIARKKDARAMNGKGANKYQPGVKRSSAWGRCQSLIVHAGQRLLAASSGCCQLSDSGSIGYCLVDLSTDSHDRKPALKMLVSCIGCKCTTNYYHTHNQRIGHSQIYKIVSAF